MRIHGPRLPRALGTLLLVGLLAISAAVCLVASARAGSTPPSPQQLALVDYTSPRGYIVPVPSSWTRTYNYSLGGYTYELFLQGTVGGDPANMVVDSENDSTVQETASYLQAIVNGSLASARSSDPGAYLASEPPVFTISGHLAITFEIAYAANPIFQDALIVVSQHDARFWYVIMTGYTVDHAVLNGTFGEIVDGFRITLGQTPTGGNGGTGLANPVVTALIIALIAVPIAAVVVIAVVMTRRRRRPVPTAPLAVYYCPRCGTPRMTGMAFCANCGAAFPDVTPQPAAPPPSPPLPPQGPAPPPS